MLRPLLAEPPSPPQALRVRARAGVTIAETFVMRFKGISDGVVGFQSFCWPSIIEARLE